MYSRKKGVLRNVAKVRKSEQKKEGKNENGKAFGDCK